jgi:CDP-diacylglycerol--glycerol-3-phosphate 3-phosphatidyltransferase
MPGLRRQWGAAALLYLLGLAAGWWVLFVLWSPDFAAIWLGPALSVAALILFELWRHLESNHRFSETALLPSLGIATALTLTRGFLLAVLAGFLVLPRPGGPLAWAPSLVYLAAVLLDYADGGVARITNYSTRLGEKLDLDLDALGILIAPLLAILYGLIPPIYVIVCLSRYLFAGGIWLLKRQGKPVYNLTDSDRRRGMAGFQMGLIVGVLMPFVVPPLTGLAAILFMIPFLAGFLRDWLVVSGSIDPRTGSYQALMGSAERLFYGWLPILYRAAILGLMIVFLLSEASAPSEQQIALILLIVQVVLSVMILTGILGRLSALGLLAAVGLPYHGVVLTPPDVALAACLLLVHLYGTGFFSLWQPEEAFLRYHMGAKS